MTSNKSGGGGWVPTRNAAQISMRMSSTSRTRDHRYWSFMRRVGYRLERRAPFFNQPLNVGAAHDLAPFAGDSHYQDAT